MRQGTLTARQIDNLPTELGAMYRSWERALKAARKSPTTIRAYSYGVAALSEFLGRTGMPTDPANITAEHIREFLIDQQERTSPETARLRRTYLGVFFSWLVKEGEIKVNPVSSVEPPAVGQDRPEEGVLTDAQWEALLATCRGRTVRDRRDAAILRLLESGGLRRSECAVLTVGDVDLDDLSVHVRRGKGDKGRTAGINPETAAAIDRYLRARTDRPTADSPLWIGRLGEPMTHVGIASVVRRRAEQAGLTGIHAHMLRHRWADGLKREGASDEVLMQLGGWKSRVVMERYGRGAAAGRALEAYHRIRG
jgi:integrase/recombinase XerD